MYNRNGALHIGEIWHSKRTLELSCDNLRFKDGSYSQRIWSRYSDNVIRERDVSYDPKGRIEADVHRIREHM